MSKQPSKVRAFVGRAFPLAKRLYWAVCRPRKRRFEKVYQTNRWGDAASVSGPGSNLDQTAVVRRELPALLRTYAIQSLLDIPCGDFFWMRHVDLGDCRYTGGDIVAALIESNRPLESPTRHFQVLDLVADRLPKVDLILCRDCLVHFSFRDARRALARIRESGSTYLLTTTYTTRTKNDDIISVNWRPINLQLAPFHFPKPLVSIDEQCTEPGRQDKHLGLWKIADLNTAP